MEGQHACKLIGDRWLPTSQGDGSSDPNLSGDELTTAARQAQKNTASQDQARQSRTDDGARDASERKARVKWSLMSDVGADPRPVGLDLINAVISYPTLEIAGEERRPCCRQQ